MKIRKLFLGSMVGATLLMTACSNGDGVAFNEDPELSTKLAELRQNGGSTNLADLTDANWDSVFISHRPVSREYIEQQVGGKIDMDDTFMQRGNILVFLRGAEIVRATYVTPDLLEPGRYSSKVRITAAGYPELLQMSE